MKHRLVDRDILAVIILSVIAVVLAFIVPPDWVPIRILTLPLVFVLPGYALTSAAFPSLVRGVPEWLLFSLGLSLVIVVLGGLVLNWTPFGLRAGSWAVLLSGITLGSCAVALVWRRGKGIYTSRWLGVGGIGLSPGQWLLLGLAVLIVGGALALSIIGAEQQARPGFTQLWILPAGGTNPKNTVRLGVSNRESIAIEYRLAVNMDGKAVKAWPSIDLNPNEQWEATLVLPQAQHGGSTRIEVDLYRAEAPTTVYRDVVLWLGT